MHRARELLDATQGWGLVAGRSASVIRGLELSTPPPPPELRVGEGEPITEAEERVSHPGRRGSIKTQKPQAGAGGLASKGARNVRLAGRKACARSPSGAFT